MAFHFYSNHIYVSPSTTISKFITAKQNKNKTRSVTFFALHLFSFHTSTFQMSPSASTGNCSKIRRIVRLRQMLLRWRKKARLTAYDVPEGHVAVCVGPSMRRFVVRASYLNHPIFKKLLMQAEEEYGFCNHGPLAIPCDEFEFEEILRVMARPEFRFSTVEDFQRRCHVDVRNSSSGESRPLLRDDSICWVSELTRFSWTGFFFVENIITITNSFFLGGGVVFVLMIDVRKKIFTSEMMKKIMDLVWLLLFYSFIFI